MTVLVAKQLGPEGFGLLNYAFAFSTFFQVLTGLGYEATLVKLVLERLDVARKIMGMAILMRFASSHKNLSVIVSHQSFFDLPVIAKKVADVFVEIEG